jgi:hypothetical protein
MALEVLTAVKTMTSLFWVVTPYVLVARYRRFGETYSLHLQGDVWRQYVPAKRWYLTARTDGATTQKNAVVVHCKVLSRHLYEVTEEYHDLLPVEYNSLCPRHLVNEAGLPTAKCIELHSSEVSPCLSPSQAFGVSVSQVSMFLWGLCLFVLIRAVGATFDGKGDIVPLVAVQSLSG